MVRLNLSTRPFYNERGLQFGMSLAGVVLGVALLAAAWQLVSLSAHQTSRSSAAAANEARAAEMRKQARDVRATVAQDDLEQVLADAREANALIDRRLFSWTELLNQIETTLPPDVMLDSVQPSFQNDRVSLRLNVVGRRVDDIDTFIQRLERTGLFRQLLSSDEQVLDSGNLAASIEGIYIAPPRPGTEAAPRPAGSPAPTDGASR